MSSDMQSLNVDSNKMIAFSVAAGIVVLEQDARCPDSTSSSSPSLSHEDRSSAAFRRPWPLRHWDRPFSQSLLKYRSLRDRAGSPVDQDEGVLGPGWKNFRNNARTIDTALFQNLR